MRTSRKSVSEEDLAMSVEEGLCRWSRQWALSAHRRPAAWIMCNRYQSFAVKMRRMQEEGALGAAEGSIAHFSFKNKGRAFS